jgi:PAS domain S-box-containing protein
VQDITERKAAEDALRAASRYARSLLEASLDPLVTISPLGKITDVNTATETVTGMPRQDLIGTDFADYFTRPDQARAGYKQVLADGYVRDYPLTIRHRSLREIDVLYNAAVYRNDAGELQGVFAAARDITERKRAEDALAASEARLRRVIESNMVGMYFWNLNGEMFNVNEAMLRILGCAGQAVSPQLHWRELTPPEHAAADERAFNEIIAVGVCTPYEKEFFRLDGSRVPVMVGAAAFLDKPYTGVALAIDITARIQAEAALARLNTELEDRVAARTAALAAANQELEAFSYSVSHDLRAPLRAMQGFSRILLEEHGPELSAAAARYTRLISENASQMGRLIDDLLAFSRLGRQALQRSTIDMRALVADALDRIAPERDGHAIDVSVGELEPCVGDAALIRQVVLNLLSNAVKFSRPRAPAVIEVGCAPRRAADADTVYFVRDNGVGFDMEYASKLFGVFQRLHPTEQFEGTGVGLATVQRIVNRHGGRVWAEAAVDAGATFFFALPRKLRDETAG